MIPHIIHMVWPGDDPFREEFHTIRASWLTHHPDWSLYFWRKTSPDRSQISDERVKRLLNDNRYSVVVKADILRLYALLTYGGVYTDVDCECLKPFDDLLLSDDFVCGYEDKDDQYACPTIMFAPPNHPFVREYLDTALGALSVTAIDFANKHPNVVTGPVLLSRLLHITECSSVRTLNHEYFYPVAANAENVAEQLKNNFSNSYTKHHWNGTTSKLGWIALDGKVDITKVDTTKLRSPGEIAASPPAMPEGPRIISETTDRPRTTIDLGAASLSVHFRRFLESFIQRHDIRTIVDYGFGEDLRLVDLIRWGARRYAGFDWRPDCVDQSKDFETSLRTFHLVTSPEFVPPKCDLILCRDGLTDDVMKRFSSRAKHYLWIVDEGSALSILGDIVFRYGTTPDKTVLWQKGEGV